MTSSHSPSPQQTLTTSSRRLPPPCWSQDETAALIDAYRDKWYSLRRGNLRASHWQEVADNVAARCPMSSGNPQKTSIQCRHKMEKLRKRYRAEIQRTAGTPKGHRYPSPWVHFKQMDLMEKGFNSDSAIDPMNQDEEDEEEEEERNCDNQNGLLLYPRGIKRPNPNPSPSPSPQIQRSYKSIDDSISGIGAGSVNGTGINENGFRIKVSGRVGSNMYSNENRVYDDYPPSMKPNYSSVKLGFGGIGKERSKRTEKLAGKSSNPVEEMVEAIKMLGDGFVRIEKMKMEMAKEVESMRMEMEMKRTEMILESQQRLVDSFSNAVLGNKKNKKMKGMMPTPDS